MPSWLSACLVVTLSLIALGVKSASAFAPGGFHIALSQRTALRHTHERCLSVPWSMEENDQRKLLRVVGAVMEDGDRVLMAQRPAGKSMGGLWEFPGGKVEEGESDEEALARECMEELGVEVRVGELLGSEINGTIHLLCYQVQIVSGELKLLEHTAMTWFLRSELPFDKTPPADLPILKKLSERTTPESS